MEVSLESIDARGLALQWPTAEGEDGPGVHVAETLALTGRLQSAGEHTVLKDCRAEALVLDLLQLVFGTLIIREGERARFTDITLGYDAMPGETHFDVAAGTMVSRRLVVEIPSMRLAAGVEAEGFRVASSTEEGTIGADSVRFRDFRVELEGVSAHFSELEATDFYVSWDEDHIRYGGKGLSCPRAVLETPSGVVTLGAIAIESLDNVDTGWAAEGLAVGEASVEIDLGGGAADPPVESDGEATALPPSPTILDGVTGRVAANVHTVLAVPFIERRAATHKPKLLVEDGLLHFPSLLEGLSFLEESLLSFRVHEGALELDIHPPLLPNLRRPLVRWPLPPEERMLAAQDQVRLRRLLFGWQPAKDEDEPAPESAADLEGSNEEGESVQLARIVVDDLDLEARIEDTGPQPGPLPRMAIDRVHLGGTVRWEADHPDRPGELAVEASGLQASLDDFPLGDFLASVQDLRGGLSSRVLLAGTRPSGVRLTLEALGARSLRAWPSP